MHSAHRVENCLKERNTFKKSGEPDDKLQPYFLFKAENRMFILLTVFSVFFKSYC